MAIRCNLCGDILDEDEEETAATIGREVCHDCLHGGVDLLQSSLADD